MYLVWGVGVPGLGDGCTWSGGGCTWSGGVPGPGGCTWSGGSASGLRGCLLQVLGAVRYSPLLTE